MTVAALKTQITADEFISLPDAEEFELIDGDVVERKAMGAEAGYVAIQLSTYLNVYRRERGVGWVLPSETTYRCFGSPRTLRRPDVSFIRSGRLPGERLPKGYIDIAPELAVEVVSPTDLAVDVEEKLMLYLKAGVALIWIIFPETRTVRVCRADRSGAILGEDRELSGEQVLPGFSCSIRELFPPAQAPTPDDARQAEAGAD